MIHEKRLPAMIAIMINSGGGDAQGSERGLEYDTVSGQVRDVHRERKCCPRSARIISVTFTKDPEGRGDDGRQFRRRGGVHDGVVSPGPVSPRADLLRHLRQPAVAA